VRGHQRVLNFATLLVAELQWGLLHRVSNEIVRLNLPAQAYFYPTDLHHR
jgi:hypothetical protein